MDFCWRNCRFFFSVVHMLFAYNVNLITCKVIIVIFHLWECIDEDMIWVINLPYLKSGIFCEKYNYIPSFYQLAAWIMRDSLFIICAYIMLVNLTMSIILSMIEYFLSILYWFASYKQVFIFPPRHKQIILSS